MLNFARVRPCCNSGFPAGRKTEKAAARLCRRVTALISLSLPGACRARVQNTNAFGFSKPGSTRVAALKPKRALIPTSPRV